MEKVVCTLWTTVKERSNLRDIVSDKSIRPKTHNAVCPWRRLFARIGGYGTRWGQPKHVWDNMTRNSLYTGTSLGTSKLTKLNFYSMHTLHGFQSDKVFCWTLETFSRLGTTGQGQVIFTRLTFTKIGRLEGHTLLSREVDRDKSFSQVGTFRKIGLFQG